MSFTDKMKSIKNKLKSHHEHFYDDRGKVYKKIKQWHPKSDVYEVIRTSALIGMDLPWFLFCLGKFSLSDVFLDNYVINKWEKTKKGIRIKGSDTRFKKFFKNLQKSHPTAAARLKLWMIYALFTGMTIGGLKLYEHKEDIEDTLKEWFEKNDEQQKITDYETFKEPLKNVTPLLIADLILKEGVKLDEKGLHKPYKDRKGNWTIGFGSTVLKNGKPVTAKTPHMTNEEAYELARWHIEEYETFPMLYWYYVFDNDLLLKTPNEVVGMGSIFYNAFNNLVENKKDSNNRNRFATLRKYRDGDGKLPCGGYGADIPESVILDCFKKYPITKQFSFGRAWLNHENPEHIANTLINFCPEGAGMYWRRWLEAGMLTGNLSPKDILECPVNSMKDFHTYIAGGKTDNESKKNALWAKTPQGWTPKSGSYDFFKEWIKKPVIKDEKGNTNIMVGKKVKDFLPEDVLKQINKSKYDPNAKIKYKKKSKAMAFNEGIVKIINKQKYSDKTFVYPFDNEYRA